MNSLWPRFQKYFLRYNDIGFTIDISRMRFADDFLRSMGARAQKAFSEMRQLEAGAIMNVDERRMVGHYWLRDPGLAPNASLRNDVEETNARIKKFAAEIHAGDITPSKGKFRHLLLIGIGGSALGPQFVADALGNASDPIDAFFFDNTDPDGFDRVWGKLKDALDETLVIVISKSGGAKDMVILPYKDRIALFSRYLQQLVMESLGKEKDREGKIVYQGIAVYGNKGSTDQHAYVQELRDGVLNFFVTFIEVQKDRTATPVKVENDFTSGDYLHGFLHGTRKALFENQRESITIGMPEVSAFSVGALIALYERAVGFYGSLVNINAYNQPGVEAGKKAATELLQLQAKVRENLNRNPRTGFATRRHPAELVGIGGRAAADRVAVCRERFYCRHAKEDCPRVSGERSGGEVGGIVNGRDVKH